MFPTESVITEDKYSKMATHQELANRIGFLILGLTNNFAYVVMLAAAFDLLKQSSHATGSEKGSQNTTAYCNLHSTSTILLADTIPSLVTKLSYPFLLIHVSAHYKVVATALFSGISFLVSGFAKSEILVFSGVVCASFSSGLGESTFLSNMPLYGNSSLSGWSMGTGAAGLLGAMVYAILRLTLSIQSIMIIMLLIPTSMCLAYFFVIKPIEHQSDPDSNSAANSSLTANCEPGKSTEESPLNREKPETKHYGTNRVGNRNGESFDEFTFVAKIYYFHKLAKYFFPLLLVYFAEYFINQGLFELIYFPEMTLLDHPSQYTWFQVSYQFGVMISRSSLDLFKIKSLWAMSFLQVLNALLFFAHAAKLIRIPSYPVVVLIIIYEGLLGGFTYVNTFFRLQTELPQNRREFSMGLVTIADTLGIVSAGLVALPVHQALCKLYI